MNVWVCMDGHVDMCVYVYYTHISALLWALTVGGRRASSPTLVTLQVARVRRGRHLSLVHATMWQTRGEKAGSVLLFSCPPGPAYLCPWQQGLPKRSACPCAPHFLIGLLFLLFTTVLRFFSTASKFLGICLPSSHHSNCTSLIHSSSHLIPVTVQV